MDGSNFDAIIQELQNQQHILEQMKAENRRLHQQLTDLRAGNGIFLEINGLSIPLNVHVENAPPALPHTTQSLAPVEDTREARQANTSALHATTIDKPVQTQIGENYSPTPQMKQPDAGKEKVALPETRKEKVVPPTFLEEIMLQEIESSLTAPLSVPRLTQKEKEKSEERQNADLRRELMGSYILE